MIEIIPVHADIQSSTGNRMSPDTGEQRTKSLRNRHATSLYPRQSNSGAVLIAFCDFVRDSGKGALDRSCV